MCKMDDESLEHLFILCPFARAVWFGINLSIRTDAFSQTNIKEWIQGWLNMKELTHLKALWFYEQLVCTLWSIWIEKNRGIFKSHCPSPIGVIKHKKNQVWWISKAF